MSMLRTVLKKLRRAAFRAPHMISCLEFEAFILDYLEGDLPSRQRRKFEFHLRLCPECRIYLRAYQMSVSLGKAVFDRPEAPLPESVPEDLITAILAARRQGSEEG